MPVAQIPYSPSAVRAASPRLRNKLRAFSLGKPTWNCAPVTVVSQGSTYLHLPAVARKYGGRLCCAPGGLSATRQYPGKPKISTVKSACRKESPRLASTLADYGQFGSEFRRPDRAITSGPPT